MALFDNTLRKIAQEKGYNVGYDPATNTVTVENPATGKKISFKSGQGQEYGMGGLDTGYNVVADVSLLDRALAADPELKSTAGAFDFFGNAAKKYSSPYSEQISKIVENIVNYKPYDYSSYDPEKDPAFRAFKESAIKAGNEAYADRYAGTAIPGVAESSIARQIAETARRGYVDRIQEAIPTYAEKARQDYENAYARYYDMLNALLRLDETEYGRYADDRAFTAQQMANYANITGYYPIDTSAIPADHPLRQYSNDYAAEIARRRAINPDDPAIPILEALRYEKIMNDPELMKKYGDTLEIPMGYKTLATRSAEAAALAEAEKTAFERALQEWKTYGIATPYVSSVIGVPVGARTADYDIDKIQAAIAQMNAQTSAKNAQTSAERLALDRQKFQYQQERDQKEDEEKANKSVFSADDFYKTAKEMKDATDKYGERLYSDNAIIGYVLNSGLSSNEISAILTRLGYSDTDVQRYINYSQPNYFGHFQVIQEQERQKQKNK